MGTINPSLMNGKQRIEEIADILATGILRLRKRRQANNSLDFRVNGSIHADAKQQGAINNAKQCIGATSKIKNHDG